MTIKLPRPTDSDIRHVLDRQVLVMLALAEDVLAGVTLDECLWKVDEGSWTVRQSNGQWIGELAEEPPDLPTPSLAWTMWHPIWWLSVLLAHSRGDAVPEPSSIAWPGPAASLETIQTMWREWMEFVDNLSEDDLRLGDVVAFPYEDGRPFIHIAGWASMELTKNLSEMCQLRRLVKDLA